MTDDDRVYSGSNSRCYERRTIVHGFGFGRGEGEEVWSAGTHESSIEPMIFVSVRVCERLSIIEREPRTYDEPYL